MQVKSYVKKWASFIHNGISSPSKDLLASISSRILKFVMN